MTPRIYSTTQYVQLICKQCHNTYDCELYEVNRHGKKNERKFCSKSCQILWKKENSTKPHKCRTCGKPISEKLGTSGWVCSAKCARKTWRKREKVCVDCGNHFETIYERVKYCSWQCYLDSRQISPLHICPQCGKEFRPPNAKASLPDSCCSWECSRLYKRGERHPLYRGKRKADRGWTWKEMQKKARERDNGECICFFHDLSYKPYRIEKCSVDHIIPYRVVVVWKKNGENVDPNHIDNLASMCRRCHQSKTTRIEAKLMIGDIAGFIEGLRTCFPSEIVERVLSLYGLFRPDRTIEIAKDWAFDRRPSDKPIVRLNSRGDKNSNANLTEAQVREIISRKEESRKIVAYDYGLTPQYVSQIICGRKWGWIQQVVAAQ